ncbi:MAG TPA: alpha/beta hydrolase domain-containing protein [Gammaproteobacteria bacterium]|nr:alpha/beta hydrolase domain-containing protein [Gammaproteobacteria bacterium]
MTSRKNNDLRIGRRVLTALVFGPWLAAGAAAAVPSPAVTLVPVEVPLGHSSRDYPQLATQLDLQQYGYVEEEFFLEGVAARYSTPDLATGNVISAGHPYKTRMIVRRPISEKNFNGTVIVEWLNVTSGYNLDAMWLTSYRHILREGYAYVGVSVQRVGVHANATGLRSWSPSRYGDLDVTDGGTILDDSLSFDIWSQAAQAIRQPAGVSPLGRLQPKLLLATGASQSQGFLVRYHNSVHPLANLYDGYLLYIGIGGKLRVDLEPKVIKVDTENDVLYLGELAARQPDSERLRIYEVAGTSHVGYSNPNLRGELLVRDGLPIADTSVCARPALSHVPTSHVVNAAFDHLVRWIEQGIEPPVAPRLEILSPLPVVIARDEYGNARGGIQLSQHAVPTATNTGANAGPGFCFLFGSHEPFDDATLRSLDPSHGRYVSSVNKVDGDNLRAGYIVKADAQQNSRDAAQADIGKY